MKKENQEIKDKSNNPEANLDEDNIVEKNENKTNSPTEKNNIVPNAKFTRPPAFIKGNNQFRGNQNNFTKSVQRKSSGRGR